MEILEGDCRFWMRRMILDQRQFHFVCCDPPYHLESIVKRFGKKNSAPAKHGTDGRFSRLSAGFIGKTWDAGEIAHSVRLWRMVLELLLPGGFCFAFSSPKTGHRMAVAMEDAGFIIHPFMGWLYSQGWPKAHAVSKGSARWPGWYHSTQTLSPALEPIYIGQRPRSEKTAAANMDRHGTGAFNVESCRVPYKLNEKLEPEAISRRGSASNGSPATGKQGQATPPGRWPSNVLLDGTASVRAGFPLAAGGRSLADNFNEFPPFLFHKKASEGDKAGSNHPTVKPVELLQWLIRLACPPGGMILDPFAGTGTTGEAARREGMQPTLIEADASYAATIRSRFQSRALI